MFEKNMYGTLLYIEIHYIFDIEMHVRHFFEFNRTNETKKMQKTVRKMIRAFKMI